MTAIVEPSVQADTGTITPGVTYEITVATEDDGHRTERTIVALAGESRPAQVWIDTSTGSFVDPGRIVRIERRSDAARQRAALAALSAGVAAAELREALLAEIRALLADRLTEVRSITFSLHASTGAVVSAVAHGSGAGGRSVDVKIGSARRSHEPDGLVAQAIFDLPAALWARPRVGGRAYSLDMATGVVVADGWTLVAHDY